jgi:hypothetical protein
MVVVVVFGLEDCGKSVLDLYANRYHRPLSDMTEVSQIWISFLHPGIRVCDQTMKYQLL